MRYVLLVILFFNISVFAEEAEKDRFDKFEEEVELTEKEKREIEISEEPDEEEFDVEVLIKSDLPKPVLKQVNKRFKNKKIALAREIYYFVSSEENGRRYLYIFNYKGELVEKEEEFDEEE